MMNMSRLVSSLIIISLMLVQVSYVANIYGVKKEQGPETQSVEVVNTNGKTYYIKRMPDKLIVMSIETKKSRIQQFYGQWWDEDWEYRINVTITEPGVEARTDWPVDVYINFDPPAFKYSIRVIMVDGGGFTEVVSQVWNATYYNDTHLSSATVTFLTTIGKGESQLYQIYWSIDYTDPPSYPKRFSITSTSTPSGTLYTITHLTRGWTAKLPPTKGGKIMNITLPNGEKIGHGWINFGVTRNVNLSYGGYWGTGDTNNIMYSDRYILEETDTLLSIYEGVIFITYIIENVPLYDTALGGINVAKVNYTYRFYDWGIIAEEKVRWIIDDLNNVDYYMAGWVFDQDDAEGCTFDKVYTPTQIYSMPPAQVYSDNGSITNVWSYYKIHNGLLPVVRIFRAYMTAGTHHVRIRATGDDVASGWGSDDVYGRVADPNGTWLQLTVATYGALFDGDYGVWGDGGYYRDSNGGITFYFDALVDGYYYFLVGLIDEDSIDGDTSFEILVDDVLIGSGVIFGYDTPNDLSYAIPRDAMSILDFVPEPDLVNIKHNFDLDWLPTDHDLDVILFEDDGSVLNYSVSSDSPPESFVFIPTSSNHHTIFVVRYSGAGTSSFTVNIEAQVGAEYEDFYNSSLTWDNLAFYHSNQSRGVGFVLMAESESGATYSNKYVIWYNDGNDSDVDYIYWARKLEGVSASTGNWYKVKYSVVLWSPSGTTDNERLSEFNSTYYALKNSLTVAKATKEKYLLSMTITVLDDDGNPIYGAKVSLINASDLSIVYNATTDKSGEAKLEVLRDHYKINVTLTSGGKAYVNDTVEVHYELYDYTIYSDAVTIKYKDLIRYRMLALTNTTPKQIIQNGMVVLTNTTDTSDKSIAYTNLTGWVDIYIKKGTWELAFNATKTTPERWDNITVYSDENLTNLVAGPSVNVTITLTTSVKYYLEDLDIQEAPVQTKLKLYQTLTSYNVYWMELITIKVNLTRTDTDENINGTVYWYIFNSSGYIVLQGTATLITTGCFQFQVNTTLLDAGASYSIKINATPVDPLPDGKHPLDPAPLSILLTVKKRPISMDVSFNPGNIIYWNESLTIVVHLADGLSGDPINDATVVVTIYASTTITKTLTFTGNGNYETTLQAELSVLDAGSYLMVITAQRQNYKTADKSSTLIIKERPTSYSAPTYITTPWVDSYTIHVSYIDDLYNAPVQGAEAKYNFSDAMTGATLLSGNLVYSDGEYILDLNLSTISEGTYSIVVFLGKKNYENITFSITFEMHVRYTSVSPETTKLTVIYGEMITVAMDYYDEDFNEYIAGATGTYTISAVNYDMPPITGSLNDLGNGTYVLDISSTSIGILGTIVAYIELKKTHYETQTLSITIIIQPIPTEAYSSVASMEIEWGLNISILFKYNRTDVDQGISDPDNATFKIYYSGNFVIGGTLLNLGNGEFLLVLNTSKFINSTHPDLGTYVLNVFFEKKYYENHTVVIPITVVPVSIISYAQPANITIIWGEATTVAIYYNRTRDLGFIYNANIVVNVYDESGNPVSVTPGALEITQNSVYVLRINTSLLDTMLYVVEVSLSKQFYDAGLVRIFINVLPIPTYIAISQKTVELEYDENIKMTVWYRYYETGEPIMEEDVNALYYIYYGEDIILDASMYSNLQYGYYYFIINATEIIEKMIDQGYNLTFPVVLAIKIMMSKEHCISQEEFITLTIYEIACYVELTETEITAEWAQKVDVGINIIRNKTMEYIKDVDITVDGLPSGSWTLKETITGYLLSIDTSKLEVVQVTNKSYMITLSFYKPYHIISTRVITLTVNMVSINLRLVETLPDYVKKVQFISEEKITYVRIILEHNATPIEDAQIVVIVSSIEAGVNNTYTAKKAPPVYEVAINWKDYPPGYNWTITVRVLSITVYGKEVPADKLSYSEIVEYIKMDYLSGSTRIPGTNKYLANMYLYPLVVVGLIALIFVSYKVISWLVLPWEVKEIIKILKMIEKGIFEYEVPEKKEYITEIVSKELSAK